MAYLRFPVRGGQIKKDPMPGDLPLSDFPGPNDEKIEMSHCTWRTGKCGTSAVQNLGF